MIFQRHQKYFSPYFADDTSVFLVGTEYTKLIELLNVELERVSCWLNANGLAVNEKRDTLYGVSPSQDYGCWTTCCNAKKCS